MGVWLFAPVLLTGCMDLLERPAALHGLMYVALSVAATFLAASGGIVESDLERRSVGEYANEWAAIDMAGSFGLWLFLLASVLLVIFAADLQLQSVGGSRFATEGAWLLVAAAVLFFVDTALVIAVAERAAPFVAENGLPAEHPFVATVDAVVLARDHVAWMAGLCLGLGVWTLAFGAWRNHTSPRWVAGVGLLGGLLGVIGVGTTWAEVLSPVRLVSFLVIWLWMALACALMLRDQYAESGAQAS